MISYGKQAIDQSDVDAVIDVLNSDWLTQGPAVEIFENNLNDYFGSKHACAVSSGTAALHLTGLALGWQPGDIIITSPITFLASANCIVYAKSTPEFVDIDSDTYTIDPNLVEDKIKFFRSKGKKVKAIIGVDYAGHPCDWRSLREIANKYEIQLVNDSCHAMGASYLDDKQYGVKYADVVTQSYHPVKHITTGEGGAVLTNDLTIDEKIRSLRAHGMTRNPNQLEKNDGPWYYEMHELGYNYRISDFQCALGISQLEKLSEWIKRRQEIAMMYSKAFNRNDLIKPLAVNDNVSHAYHLYVVRIDFSKLNIDRTNLFMFLKKNNIGVNVHYIPVHLHPFYRKNFKTNKGDCPIAEFAYEQIVSLPIYPAMEDASVLKVIKVLKDIMNKNAK